MDVLLEIGNFFSGPREVHVPTADEVAAQQAAREAEEKRRKRVIAESDARVDEINAAANRREIRAKAAEHAREAREASREAVNRRRAAVK